MRRTAVVNQIRSLLLERGLTLPKGRRYVEEALPRILEDAELPLSGSFRLLLAQLKLELEQLSARIDQLDVAILERAKEDEACQRLTTIPGVGPVTATAVRRMTQRSRTRCSVCKSSCSSLLIGTKRIRGRCTASAIASASM